MVDLKKTGFSLPYILEEGLSQTQAKSKLSSEQEKKLRTFLQSFFLQMDQQKLIQEQQAGMQASIQAYQAVNSLLKENMQELSLHTDQREKMKEAYQQELQIQRSFNEEAGKSIAALFRDFNQMRQEFNQFCQEIYEESEKFTASTQKLDQDLCEFEASNNAEKHKLDLLEQEQAGIRDGFKKIEKGLQQTQKDFHHHRKDLGEIGKGFQKVADDILYIASHVNILECDFQRIWQILEQVKEDFKQKIKIKESHKEIRQILNQAQKDLNQMETDLNQMKESHQETRQTLNQTEEDLNQIETDLNQIKESHQETRQTLDQTQKDFSQIRESYKETEQTLHQTENDLNQIQEDYKEIENTLTQMGEDYKEIGQTLHLTKKDFNQLKEDDKQTEQTLNQVAQDQLQMEEELDQIEDDFKETNQNVNELEELIREIRRKTSSFKMKANNNQASEKEMTGPSESNYSWIDISLSSIFLNSAYLLSRITQIMLSSLTSIVAQTSENQE